MEPEFEHCYKYEGLVVEQLRHFLQHDFHDLCYTGVLELQTEFAYSEEPVPFNEIGTLTFKPAYDGNGFVLRMFECAGKAAKVKLSLPEGCKLDGELNLLEEKIGDVGTELEFKPFQIRTFKILK